MCITHVHHVYTNNAKRYATKYLLQALIVHERAVGDINNKKVL